MACESESFDLSGPSYLTRVDWKNANHRTSVAACLVQGVYVLERDRQEKRAGLRALAPPWSEIFKFRLQRKLIDKADSSIFGAVFEYKPPSSFVNHSADGPLFVIAFRGNLIEPQSVAEDMKMNIDFIQHNLPATPRFKTAMEAVQSRVQTAGNSRVWLAGHSLGSAMALLAGKNMAKNGSLLESLLFNPPYVSAPIEKISNETVKHGLRFFTSLVTAGLALACRAPLQWGESSQSFAALSHWVPQLFVNTADHFCSEYIGYFGQRKKMQEMGAGAIQRLATQNSLASLLMNKNGAQAEPPHVIPSANLTINSNPSMGFIEAHGICQWWQDDLSLQSEVYMYD